MKKDYFIQNKDFTLNFLVDDVADVPMAESELLHIVLSLNRILEMN